MDIQDDHDNHQHDSRLDEGDALARLTFPKRKGSLTHPTKISMNAPSSCLVFLGAACLLIGGASLVRVASLPEAENGDVRRRDESAKFGLLVERYLDPTEATPCGLLPKLKEVGPSILPLLLAAYRLPDEDALDDGFYRLRDAVEAIGSQQALPYLVDALDDRKLIAAAAYGIAGLGADRRDMLERLKVVFDKPTTTVRHRVSIVWTMGMIGESSVASFLEEQTRSEDRDVAWAAGEALDRIQLARFPK